MEDWKMAANNKEYLTDMSEAFDSLHPALMIQKHKAYGFFETSLKALHTAAEPAVRAAVKT